MAKKHSIHKLIGRSRKIIKTSPDKNILKDEDSDVSDKQESLISDHHENNTAANELSTRVTNHSDSNLDMNSAVDRSS